MLTLTCRSFQALSIRTKYEERTMSVPRQMFQLTREDQDLMFTTFHPGGVRFDETRVNINDT
jgi:hypothetical protein